MSGMLMADIQIRGRWRSIESCTHYIQAGRALFLMQDLPAALCRLGHRLIDSGDRFRSIDAALALCCAARARIIIFHSIIIFQGIILFIHSIIHLIIVVFLHNIICIIHGMHHPHHYCHLISQVLLHWRNHLPCRLSRLFPALRPRAPSSIGIMVRCLLVRPSSTSS